MHQTLGLGLGDEGTGESTLLSPGSARKLSIVHEAIPQVSQVMLRCKVLKGLNVA